MVKILAFSVTEPNRVRMCMIVGIVNWVCLLLSVIMIGIGAYVKVTLNEYMHLVEDYDSDTFPYLMVSVGLFSFMLNAAAGYIFFMSNNPKKREMLRPFYFVYIALGLLTALLIFIGGCFCFSHIGHLEESFQNGLTSSMDSYKSNVHKKKAIDQMQLSYQCCGNDFYEDWFTVDWIAPKYRKDFDLHWDTARIHDHVPFSCCRADILRPCVHTDVHDNFAHEYYDYSVSLTVYDLGCREALMNYFREEILKPSGALIFVIFILQLCLVVTSRFLQTSITSALAKGSPTIQSEAYFLQFGPEAGPGQDQSLIQPGQYPMDDESEGDPRDLGDTWDEITFEETLNQSPVKGKKSGGGFEQQGPPPERRRSSGRNVRTRVSSHSLLKKQQGEASGPENQPQQQLK